MKRYYFFLLSGILLMVIGLSLASTSQGLAQSATQAATTAATKAATTAATAAATKQPTPKPITDPVGKPPSFLLTYYQAWLGSGHAKTDSEAFVHWNADGAVPAGCAQCHSTPGYIDYLGDDASAYGKVEQNAPIGSVINCDGCHSKTAVSVKEVTFPSGAKLGNMGDSTRCIICHQGRASTIQVNAAIEKLGLTKDVNKVDAGLSFVNVHYFAAAATLYGSEAHGGYEFTGNLYATRNNHVDGYNTCAGCHDQHTLKVKVNECAQCHKDVKTAEDLRKIRMNGSLTDFNGNGNIKEGIAAEIDGVRDVLYKTMQAYALKVTGKGIVYDAGTNPYFFIDTNKNGKADKEEVVSTNRYNAFSPVLLEAAYNYQVSTKDPGAFAHNPKYILELLYDSTVALTAGLGGDGTTALTIQRDAPAHFNYASEPFRHWDKDGTVPSSCAKCHTAVGLPTFLANGTTLNVTPPSKSFACTTCHNDLTKFTTYTVKDVTFPSGAVVSLGRNAADNLCLNCHQGRESTVSVNKAITDSKAGPDDVTDKLNFRNVHYFAAGASLFGNEAKGAYQYDGKQYDGRNEHKAPYTTCSQCHDTHALTVNSGECSQCHKDAKTLKDIRFEDDKTDFNGNGNKTEGVYYEIQGMQADLYKAIQSYALAKSKVAIVYDPLSYPYYFVDKNGDGKLDKADADDKGAYTGYNKWTPNLLRAAYNYQYVTKDPGAFTHNPKYIIEILYDSVESMGGKDAVAKYTRPTVTVKPAATAVATTAATAAATAAK